MGPNVTDCRYFVRETAALITARMLILGSTTKKKIQSPCNINTALCQATKTLPSTHFFMWLNAS